jgi:hypothetical protein
MIACAHSWFQIKDVMASGLSVSVAHAGLRGVNGAEDRPLSVASGPLLAVTWDKEVKGE